VHLALLRLPDVEPHYFARERELKVEVRSEIPPFIRVKCTDQIPPVVAQETRPPLPPFIRETAIQKARLAEDGWNSRDPEKVALGISGALWGEVTAKNGRDEQSNFHNYRVLRMNETPPIEVHLVRNSEAPGGIGEPVTAPALGNAIYAATGKRLRKLPLQSGLGPVAR